MQCPITGNTCLDSFCYLVGCQHDSEGELPEPCCELIDEEHLEEDDYDGFPV